VRYLTLRILARNALEAVAFACLTTFMAWLIQIHSGFAGIVALVVFALPLVWWWQRSRRMS
jgi:predicted exporter